MLVLFLGILEFGLRISRSAPGIFFEPDENLGEWYMANASYGFDNEGCSGWGSSGVISSQRLRDHEYPYERQPNTYRILLLGDSFTDGVNMQLENTWGELLETHLNTRNDGIRYEVISAGKIGAYFAQEYLVYQHIGTHFHPDLVLLLTTFNDFYDNDPFFNVGGFPYPYYKLVDDQLVLDESFRSNWFYQFVSLTHTLRPHSYLIDYFTGQTAEYMMKTNIQYVYSLEDTASPDQLDPYEEHAIYLAKRVILALSRRIEQDGADFGLLIGADKRPTNYNQVADPTYQFPAFYNMGAILIPFAQENEIPHLDLQPALQAYSVENHEYVVGCEENGGVGHWSESGNRMVAETVYHFLQTEGWIQRDTE